MGGAKKPELAKVLCENSGSDVEWLMDKSDLDLSLVAGLGGHAAPRNPSRQGAFLRHDHYLCPDSDGGESVHWFHLRERRSYFQGVLTCDFRQWRLQCGFHQQLTVCTVSPSQPLEQLIDVLEKPKGRFFLHSWSYPVPHHISKIGSLFKAVLTRCEFGTRTELTITVGLGLCSAVSFDVPYDSLFTKLELTALKPWSELLAGESLPVQLPLMMSLAFFPSPRWSSPQRNRGWSRPQERHWVSLCSAAI